jgi:hypothetical protein
MGKMAASVNIKNSQQRKLIVIARICSMSVAVGDVFACASHYAALNLNVYLSFMTVTTKHIAVWCYDALLIGRC